MIRGGGGNGRGGLFALLPTTLFSFLQVALPRCVFRLQNGLRSFLRKVIVSLLRFGGRTIAVLALAPDTAAEYGVPQDGAKRDPRHEGFERHTPTRYHAFHETIESCWHVGEII